jgi:ectoine hydroxylase-related dioxygenase (phytanoyl-CoA dioxygenase family)
MKFLTEAQYEFYKENGYIIIEDFLKKPELDKLLASLDALVQEKARDLNKDKGDFNLEKTSGGSNGDEIVAPGLLRKIQSIVDYNPDFAELAQCDKLLDLVEDLIGPTIYYHSSKLMFKPAKHGGIKPWHQDYAYWASTKPEQVTCWLALDNATEENGCMQLIPGSHKWGLVKHGQAELQVDPKNIPVDKKLIAPMKAGSLLCFHVLTFHHSGPNRSDKHRRAFIVDFDPNERPAKANMGGDRLVRKDGVRVGNVAVPAAV